MGDDNQEDTLYSVLRGDILDLRLKPGVIISIKDICDTYDMGRTPVRDALIRLSKERLITFLPQRGTMISKINLDRAENQRFMRTCVEESVMLEFMANCNLEIITELELSLDRQAAIAGDGDIREFLQEDMQFHSIFYKASNHAYCNQVISANSGDYRRIRLLSLTDKGINNSVIKQHRELVDSILAKEADRMHRVFDHHLNKLVAEERVLRDKYLDLFDMGEDEVKREAPGLGVDFLVETKLRYNN